MRRLLSAAACAALLACPDLKPAADASLAPDAAASLLLDAGSSASLAERVRARLVEAVPDATVVVANSNTLLVKAGALEMKLGLDNVRLRCGTPEACDSAVTMLVENAADALRRSAARDGGQEVVDRASLRLVLKDAGWLASVDAQLRKIPEKYEDNALVTEPFAADLSVVLVVDQPKGMRMLRRADLKALGLDAKAAGALARANLAAAFPSLFRLEKLSNAPVWTNADDEDYAAALLTLPAPWAPLARERGGALTVAAPARNRIFACNGTRACAATLRTLAASAAAEDDHPLTTALFDWSPRGFTAHRGD